MAEVALVTGASSGIGAEFAQQLSASGYDVILVARRSDRMEQLRAQLAGPSHVVVCDLATEAAALAEKVAGLGLQVDVLVNNAGFGTHGRFSEIDPAREAEEVRVNCEALVTLTHAFLPGMLERRHGGVITVASTAGRRCRLSCVWSSACTAPHAEAARRSPHAAPMTGSSAGSGSLGQLRRTSLRYRSRGRWHDRSDVTVRGLVKIDDHRRVVARPGALA